MKTKEQIEEALLFCALGALTVENPTLKMVSRNSMDLLCWVLDKPNNFESCVMTPFKAELAQQVKAE